MIARWEKGILRGADAVVEVVEREDLSNVNAPFWGWFSVDVGLEVMAGACWGNCRRVGPWMFALRGESGDGMAGRKLCGEEEGV